MYDIRKVTRYVLVRKDVRLKDVNRQSGEGAYQWTEMGHESIETTTDLAEFKRRDEAEAVLKALNGRFEAERAAAQKILSHPTEYDF
jgi:hypothetical protein